MLRHRLSRRPTWRSEEQVSEVVDAESAPAPHRPRARLRRLRDHRHHHPRVHRHPHLQTQTQTRLPARRRRRRRRLVPPLVPRPRHHRLHLLQDHQWCREGKKDDVEQLKREQEWISWLEFSWTVRMRPTERVASSQ